MYVKCRYLVFCFLLVLHTFCLAQQNGNPISSLQDSSVIIEKVYLQTDRDYYSQGDNIWFKAWLVEDPDLYLSSNSMNLHVELVSVKSGIIDTRIIKMDGGLGKGDFNLSDSVEPGPYLIRAYTYYMRNFNDIQFFEKALKIFSTSEKDAGKTEISVESDAAYDVRFFPEGGSLVSNITCSVALKATDKTGRGCNVSGDIYTTSGGLVTSFITTHKGMGRFFLRPASGIKYYTIIKTPDGKILRKNLPESFEQGVTMNITDIRENGPLITVRTNQGTLSTIADPVHFISVSAHKSEFFKISFSISAISTSIRLPVDELPDGIIQLTLKNSDGVPLCERLFFNNINKVRLKVETDKPVYSKRSPISVSLSLTGDSINPETAFLAMSAAETGFLNAGNKVGSSISSWFLLESDIRGVIEDPASYFDSANPEMTENLDLLLCTHGWRDFKWKYEEPLFPPEYGFTISGEVKKRSTESPVKDAVINAILKKEKSQLIMNTFTDSLGRFRFEELDFSGQARLIANAFCNDPKSNRLIIDSARYTSIKSVSELSRVSLMYRQDSVTACRNSYAENEFITRKNISKKFLLSDTILLGEVTIVARKKRESAGAPSVQPAYVVQKVAVGIPDAVIKITSADERYTSFRDIIRKGVSGVRVEAPRDASESGIRIRGSSLEPLFMLDGIPVPYSIIESFPVKWIERIDIMKSGGIATSLSQGVNSNPSFESEPKYNGVISIISKPEEKRTEKLPVYNSINRTVKGFDAPRIFYSPDYSVISEQTFLPDLRTTLKWDPDVVVSPGKETVISFYNNDKQGVVKVVVEGITTGGVPVTGSVEYEVR